MSAPVIVAERLGKRYRIGERFHETTFREAAMRWFRGRGANPPDTNARLLWALRDLSFEINEGEIVGVIGRNGAGKTTLLKMLSGITEPTEGRAELRGTIGSLLEVGTGFHPELTGRENVYLNGAILGMKKVDIDRRFDEIVTFAGTERFLDTPVKRYSSGMQVRLAFAVAAHMNPDVLLVDEVLAVGDSEFQKKCLQRMEDVSISGRTVVFVSHSMPAVLRLCPRVILLDGGRMVADGGAREVVRAYFDSGLGTTAARVWPSATDAPGDDTVRLTGVRVRSGGQVAEEIEIRRPVDIEIEYIQLEAAANPRVFLSLWNEDGLLLFVSSNMADKDWLARPKQYGAVRTTCRIPGNFLAEGQFFVHVAIYSHAPQIQHLTEPDVVAFQVVDQTTGDGVRGEVVRDWPGVLRPMLEWSTEARDTDT